MGGITETTAAGSRGFPFLFTLYSYYTCTLVIPLAEEPVRVITVTKSQPDKP